MKSAAGLPNITGAFRRDGSNTDSYGFNGSFYKGYVYNTWRNTNDHHGNQYQINFDASRSNSIYGASTTVQPKSIKIRYIIKY